MESNSENKVIEFIQQPRWCRVRELDDDTMIETTQEHFHFLIWTTFSSGKSFESLPSVK